MKTLNMTKQLGACYLGHGKCRFTVWAPLLDKLSLSIENGNPRVFDLKGDSHGYFDITIEDIPAGTKYFYQFDNFKVPDPASFYQPQNIVGPSCVVDHAAFKWRDQKWRGILQEEMIIYEIHVGTFTSEGTFETAIKRLEDIRDLGITAIEIMPVAQFPGERNWGYDGVYPFAVQNSYGGPNGLKAFVDACHYKGIAVILDVVYNHLGPEGNFLSKYMPCFTDKYLTPWGKAINYDDAYSFGVRDFFIQNALYWLEHYHVDALRVDAVHGIFDFCAKHFLRELSDAVEDFSRQRGRKFYLIAESDLNDTRVILPAEKGGYGIDAQWNDDFHHALHGLLTKETFSYYQDFGQIEHFVKALKEGFVYSWNYSNYRKRYHGNSSKDIPPKQFVVCMQNHDQIGNRCCAQRLSLLVSFEALKLAAGAVILSPYIPLIFMGEEYAETAPFFYFISFYDKQLVQAVREGRQKICLCAHRQEEFDAPCGFSADPYSTNTFLSSKLNWHQEGRHKALLNFYKAVISLRKNLPVFKKIERDMVDAGSCKEVVIVNYKHQKNSLYVVMNFSSEPRKVEFNNDSGVWHKILDSSDMKWNGPGCQLPDIIYKKKVMEINSFNFGLYTKQ